MSTRQRWLGGAAVAVLVAVTALAVTGSGVGAGPSVLSRGAMGWQVAHHYLDARGSTTELGDRPFGSNLDTVSTVVIAAPVQRGFEEDELQRLDRFVRSGGTLVWAYSGIRITNSETRLADLFELEIDRCDTDPPLQPIAWWRHQKRTEQLEPLGAGDHVRPVLVRPPRWVPRADPDRSVVMYQDGQGRPLIFRHERGRGQVIVLPAEALANCRIAEPGNADLLETLLGLGGGTWLFDEHRHGLSAPDVERASPAQRSLDLLLLHVLLVYLLALWALAKRFGPVWRQRDGAFGSTATFLLGLGRLHDRLGHHAEATARLVERARTLDPRLQLGSPPSPARDRAGLMALARWLGRRQQGASGATTPN